MKDDIDAFEGFCQKRSVADISLDDVNIPIGNGGAEIIPTPTHEIVEDNDLNSKLLNDLLQYQGYTVVTTRFGEAALELARRYKPDAILMDIQLPDISGMEATRRIKADQETRTIPIIVVTAFAMPGDEANILASGCDAYVAKPFNVRDFLVLVDRWTGRTDF